MSNKTTLEEHETIALIEKCSVLIQNKLPIKLKDPDSFFIPCLIGNICVHRALCDLGSSVSLMPLSMSNKLDLEEIRPNTVTVGKSFCEIPIGVLENVPSKVADLYMPVGFVILEIEEDMHTTIILRRSFLATAKCRIDVKNGKLSFDVAVNIWSLNCLRLLSSLLFLMNVIELM